MKKVLVVLLAAAILAVGSEALAGSAAIKITSAGFTPADVSVQSGDSVNWTNSDTVRHEVNVSGTSCTLSLEPAQSSSCTFPAPGTFPYNDPTASGSGFIGKITVAQNSRSVTLTTSRTLNIFGDAVTLSGTVSSKRAGEHVTVVGRPTGEPEWRSDVVTVTGGNWRLQVQPRVRTTYQALYDTAASQPLTVSIRPRLTFQKIARHAYLVVVLASRSMAGKQLDVARWSNGRWVVYRQATLRSIQRTPTTSVAYFTSYVRLGTKLRAFLPASQVGSDYLEGHSNFVVN